MTEYFEKLDELRGERETLELQLSNGLTARVNKKQRSVCTASILPVLPLSG